MISTRTMGTRRPSYLLKDAPRGELPPETDVPLLLESLIGPLYLRLLVTGEELSEEFMVRVVDLILDGVLGRTGEGTE